MYSVSPGFQSTLLMVKALFETSAGAPNTALVVAAPDGSTMPRPGTIGPQVDPSLTTVVVPFNDVDALESALAAGDIACVLAEPALTNIGIVLPQPGYHDAVREITRRHGVLLIIDETHTISAGPGGCTKAWGLDPDMVVIGKPIGGGFPVATYGVTDEIAATVVFLASDLSSYTSGTIVTIDGGIANSGGMP